MRASEMRLFLVLLVINSLISSCSSNDSEIDAPQIESNLTDDEIANGIANNLADIARQDSVPFGNIQVVIDTLNQKRKALIYWDPVMTLHDKLIQDYNKTLLKNISEKFSETLDSIIFEMDTNHEPDYFKRYRASREEFENMKVELNSDYSDFIRLIVREKKTECLSYLDLYWLKAELNQGNDYAFVDIKSGFLGQVEQLLMRKDLTREWEVAKNQFKWRYESAADIAGNDLNCVENLLKLIYNQFEI